MNAEQHRRFLQEVLRAGAFTCPGECGLDERACAELHPVQWAGTAREGKPDEVTWIEGTTQAIADLIVAAYEQAGLKLSRVGDIAP